MKRRINMFLSLLPIGLLCFVFLILPFVNSLYVSLSDSSPKTNIIVQEFDQSVFGPITRRVVEQTEVPVLNDSGDIVYQWIPSGTSNYQKLIQTVNSDLSNESLEYFEQNSSNEFINNTIVVLNTIIKFLNHNEFLLALLVTLLSAIMSLPIVLFIGFGLALLFNTSKSRLFKNLVATIALLPIAANLLLISYSADLLNFVKLINDNIAIKQYGIIGGEYIEFIINYISTFKSAAPSLLWIILILVWLSIPYIFLIFCVSFLSSSNSSIQAAKIDGAKGQKFSNAVASALHNSYFRLAIAAHLLITTGSFFPFDVINQTNDIPSLQSIINQSVGSSENLGELYSLSAAASVILMVCSLILVITSIPKIKVILATK